MRIALLISGEFRECKIAHKFWNFLKWSNVDVFWSLWNTSTIVYPNLDQVIEEVDYELINSTNPISTIIEPPFKNKQHNALKMIHRIKEGIKLILNSGKKYDVVIIMRPDIMFVESDEYFHQVIEKSYKENICMIDGYNPNYSGDQLMIFPIRHAISFLKYNFFQHIDYSGQYQRCDIHKMMAEFLRGKAEEMPGFVHKHAIVRVLARRLCKRDQHDFKRILNTTAEWWTKKYNLPYYIPGNI